MNVLSKLTFPEIESILLNCLPRPRMSVLHVPQVISDSHNAQDLIEISLKIDNYFYELQASGTVSLDLDFKMQFGTESSIQVQILLYQKAEEK